MKDPVYKSTRDMNHEELIAWCERIAKDPQRLAAIMRDRDTILLERNQYRQALTTDGIARIANERQRQISKLGWSLQHDDRHQDGSLALSAACYAASAACETIYVQRKYANGVRFEDPFPWTRDARPYNGSALVDPTREQAIRLLEKAGALIAAEIDRLLRASERAES